MKLRKEQTPNRGKRKRSMACGVLLRNVYYIFSTTVLMQYTCTRMKLIDLLEISLKLSNTFASSYKFVWVFNKSMVIHQQRILIS